MTQEDVNNEKMIADGMIKIANELITKLSANEKTIEERKISLAATEELSEQVEQIINGALAEARSGDADLTKRIERVIEILTMTLKNIGSMRKATSDDVIRLIATQDGMKRALETVKETGHMRLREIEKIVKLSQQEDPERRRKIGEHPETVATKRNAKTLKQDQERNDT